MYSKRLKYYIYIYMYIKLSKDNPEVIYGIPGGLLHELGTSIANDPRAFLIDLIIKYIYIYIHTLWKITIDIEDKQFLVETNLSTNRMCQ